MGKKKSTTIKETALGEEQVATITGNQANISNQVNEGFANTAATGAQLVDGQGVITQNQQTMTDNQGTIIGNQDALKTGQTNLSAQIAAIPQTQVVTQTVDTSGIENRIGTLEGTTQSGFDTMGGRFDTVDSSLGTIGTNVTEGFAGVNESLDSIDTNVTDLGTAQAQGFEDAETNRAAMQEAILGATTGITNDLTDFRTSADTQLGSLVTGQQALTEGQGTLQTGLTDFQDQYTTDYAVTSNFLGEMANNMGAGFEAQEDNAARAQDAADAAMARRGVGGGLTIEQVEAAVQRAVAQANPQAAAGQVDYARIAKEVSTGVSNQVQDGQSNAQDWAMQLASIRTLIQTQGANMDQDMRYSYTALANSFDNTGKLLANTVDENGIRTARAIDEQGNLLLARFDSSNNLQNQEQYNINSMLQQMNATLMQFQAGGNYNMGQLSNPYNRGAGGIMSPYSRSMRRGRRFARG